MNITRFVRYSMGLNELQRVNDINQHIIESHISIRNGIDGADLPMSVQSDCDSLCFRAKNETRKAENGLLENQPKKEKSANKFKCGYYASHIC